MEDVEALAETRAQILGRIAAAAARFGRAASSVEVVAVTKTVPAGRIKAAMVAGFRTLGENRVQERRSKAAELDALPLGREPGDQGACTPLGNGIAASGPRPKWHLVGPLQSNKARRAVELFDVIETVDSLALAQRLDRLASEIRPGTLYPVLLQVNVDTDATKSGFELADLDRDLPAILDLPALSVGGLMTVGRLVEAAEEARPTFVALRDLSERLRARDERLGRALSMGMSGDYAIAVEEGATLVRIGSAIFGARPTG
jgi:pyridoxal phosphate enzyme (YggS family)